MFAGDGPDTLILGWEKVVCGNVIRNSKRGFAVFPNEIPNNTFPVGVDALEIQNNVAANGEIILRIIVCIDYAFTFLGDRHQTSYIWEIDKKNPLTGFAHIKPGDGAVQPNDLLKLTDPSLPGRAKKKDDGQRAHGTHLIYIKTSVNVGFLSRRCASLWWRLLHNTGKMRESPSFLIE
jgi:hypothetical protein